LKGQKTKVQLFIFTFKAVEVELNCGFVYPPSAAQPQALNLFCVRPCLAGLWNIGKQRRAFDFSFGTKKDLCLFLLLGGIGRIGGCKFCNHALTRIAGTSRFYMQCSARCTSIALYLNIYILIHL